MAYRGKDTERGRVSPAELKQYRDITPETVSNQELLDLIRKHRKNDAAIKDAISAMWNDIENIATKADEWISTGKKHRKKDQYQDDRGGGRGRGRSAPAYRGRDGGRGSRGGRSTSSPLGRGPPPRKSSPTEETGAVYTLTNEDTVGNSSSSSVPHIITHDIPSPCTATPRTTASPDILVTGKVAWEIGGISLAQKLKAAEQTQSVSVPAIMGLETKPCKSAGGSKPSSKGAREDSASPLLESPKSVSAAESNEHEKKVATVSLDTLTDAAESILVFEPEPIIQDSSVVAEELTPTLQTVQASPPREPSVPDTVGSPLIKLGKWESAETDGEVKFAFGNFVDEPSSLSSVPSENKETSTPGQSVYVWRDKETGGPLEEGLSSLSAFDKHQTQHQDTTSTITNDSEKSLFVDAQKQQTTSPNPSSSLYVEPKQEAKQGRQSAPMRHQRKRNSVSKGQQEQAPAQCDALKNTPCADGQRNSQVNAGTAGMAPVQQHEYGSDLPSDNLSSPVNHQQQPNSSPPPSSSGTDATSTNQNSSQQDIYQQQNGQMGNYGYYGNPYYPQYFYGGGSQFYGRGGHSQDMYRPPIPYGDPYGAAHGMGGYGDMYGHGSGGHFAGGELYTAPHSSGQNDQKGVAAPNGSTSQPSRNQHGCTQGSSPHGMHSGGPYCAGGYGQYRQGEQWNYGAGWGQMMPPYHPGPGWQAPGLGGGGQNGAVRTGATGSPDGQPINTLPAGVHNTGAGTTSAW